MPDSASPDARNSSNDRTALDRKLARVRRRVFLNRLVGALCVDFFVALCLFAGYLLVHRLVHLTVDPLWVFAGLGGAALLVATIRTVVTGRASALEAAILVDDALELRERVSTAVYL